MCSPEFFEVKYSINPWMIPAEWALDTHFYEAVCEWLDLRNALLKYGVLLEFIPPIPDLPDLVFTANAAVVLDRKALLAHFRHPERQKEEVHFETAFKKLQGHGLIDDIYKLPDDVVLEGAGDCVWDEHRCMFWMGYGQRSDEIAKDLVGKFFKVETVALELADPRFYHMDTALCPLPRGEVLIVPCAFTERGKKIIQDRVSPDQMILLTIEDAIQFAANAICLNSKNILLMSNCGDRLKANLVDRGYHVVTTPLHSFHRAGGSAFCLTLRLDHHA